MRRRVGLVVVVLIALSVLLVRRAQSHTEREGVPLPSVSGAFVPSAKPVAVRETIGPPAQGVTEETVIEVRVTAEDVPVSEAQITALRQVALSPSWRPSWEPPALQRTDLRGLGVITAREGTWVLAVAKEGFATATIDVVKPAGERVTVLQVSLERGFSLSGTAIDSNDRAVAPAVIRAVPLGDRPSSRRGSHAGVVETTVDARGVFRFASLASGWWRLEGDAEGAGKADPKLVNLPTGDGVQLRFRRSGFLEGVVVQPDGGVARGALVVVMGLEQTESVEAGPTGTFSIERMPGDYRLSASHEVHVGTAAEVALVRAGRTTQVRIVIVGKGGILEGTVKRDDGVPVAGARVTASPHNEEGTCGQAFTAEDGTWRISDLPRGTYDLDAEASGLMSSVQRGFFVMEGASARAELVLGRLGKIAGVVESSSGTPLSARVMLRSKRNSFADRQAVADRSGHFAFDDVPPGPAFVRAVPTPDEPSPSVDLKVEAGATSEVKVTVVDLVALEVELDRTRCVALPSVTLTAMQSGQGDFQKRIQRLVPKGTSRVTLRLSPGGWQVFSFAEGCAVLDGSKNLTIEAGAKLPLLKLVMGPLPPGLEVTVLERDGEPAPFAEVSALSDDGGEWVSSANADGVAMLGFKDGVSMTICATKQGRSARVEGVQRSRGRISLTLAAAAQVHLRLEGAVGSTQLMVAIGGSSQTDQLQTSGDEAWLQDIPAGSVTLTAFGSNKTIGMTRVMTSPGKTAEATIRMQPVAQVQGKVLRPSGNVSLAQISLKSSLMTDFESVLPDGSFAFEIVNPGEYTAKVECEGCAFSAKTVQVRPGETVQLQFP